MGGRHVQPPHLDIRARWLAAWRLRKPWSEASTFPFSGSTIHANSMHLSLCLKATTYEHACHPIHPEAYRFLLQVGIALSANLVFVSEYIGSCIYVLSAEGECLQTVQAPFGDAYACALASNELHVSVGVWV